MEREGARNAHVDVTGFAIEELLVAVRQVVGACGLAAAVWPLELCAVAAVSICASLTVWFVDEWAGVPSNGEPSVGVFPQLVRRDERAELAEIVAVLGAVIEACVELQRRLPTYVAPWVADIFVFWWHTGHERHGAALGAFDGAWLFWWFA